MQVWLQYLPGQGYEQKSLHAEKMAKGTHFDIFTSLLNTTFKWIDTMIVSGWEVQAKFTVLAFVFYSKRAPV